MENAGVSHLPDPTRFLHLSRRPSLLPRTLVAFSIVVFFLLKTGLLLCTQKGPVCGVQLHFKGTLLVSYEFACLY